MDSIKALKLLREKGKMSEDLVLMAEKMYLQKAIDFSACDNIGVFMVVGLKESTLYVIKATPKVNIKGSWLC